MKKKLPGGDFPLYISTAPNPVKSVGAESIIDTRGENCFIFQLAYKLEHCTVLWGHHPHISLFDRIAWRINDDG